MGQDRRPLLFRPALLVLSAPEYPADAERGRCPWTSVPLPRAEWPLSQAQGQQDPGLRGQSILRWLPCSPHPQLSVQQSWLQKSLEARWAGRGRGVLHKSPLMCRKSRAAFRLERQRSHPAQKGRNSNCGYFWPLTTTQRQGCSASWWVSLDSADLGGGQGAGTGSPWGYPTLVLASPSPPSKHQDAEIGGGARFL